jgi:hypothetical protein
MRPHIAGSLAHEEHARNIRWREEVSPVLPPKKRWVRDGMKMGYFNMWSILVILFGSLTGLAVGFADKHPGQPLPLDQPRCSR